MEEIKYTLMHLEEVAVNLRKPFFECARDIINRYDETGIISEYEYQLSTNLVMMGYEK